MNLQGDIQLDSLPYPGQYREDDSQRQRVAAHPKLNCYRLLVIGTTAGFGISKARLSYQGYSTAPNTIDWLYGVVVFLMLYWLGIYERHATNNMPPWLFETDLLSILWKFIRNLSASFWRLCFGRKGRGRARLG
ncbi:hypothetical protein B0H34DRAFT_411238 [Crassisporium funariophilum]|nr:hypothetical protein B0H34DRAFT_411238 [Crassisporium funariophilum]